MKSEDTVLNSRRKKVVNFYYFFYIIISNCGLGEIPYFLLAINLDFMTTYIKARDPKKADIFFLFKIKKILIFMAILYDKFGNKL